ncbi:MAG: hypothetical protein ABR556_11290 [Pyrinomonadaceae bacterium]
MKKIIWLLAIYASLGAPLVPGFANVTELKAQTPATAQEQCTDESKGAWYADFTKFRIPDPPKAYEAAKKYLAACPQEEGPIPTYLKKWSAQYDKDARKLKLQPLLYEKKYAEAFALGKQILADEPDNLRVIIDLGYAGYPAMVAKNDSFSADSLNYARKAIQMIESGKAPESWAPYKGKEDTLAYLNNAIGHLTLKSNPAEALSSLIKAARFDSELKKDPWTYYFIAASYEAGPYAQLSADYKTKFEGKDKSPESELALANIQQVIDRMVDAYARAVALAGNDAKYQVNKKEWMESLTTWYKYRHNQSDAGLNEMIASVLAKPLPPEPTALTTLPASATTTTTPASGTVSSSGSTSAPGAPVPAATNKTTTTPAASTLATTSKVTTTPAAAVTTKRVSTTTKVPTKPKSRNNHRRQ